MSVSIPSKSSWVALSFAVLLCHVFYASMQPVNRFHESNAQMAVGADGRVYLNMAKQLPSELQGIEPYVYRIGGPLAVAAVAKSLDWVIAAGFDRLAVACNVVSVLLLFAFLRRSVTSVFSVTLVILLFLMGPYWPTRYSYFHPLSIDSFVLLGVVATLLAIEWFRDKPSLERALVVTLMTIAGVTIHELLLIPGLSLALAGERNSPQSFSWRQVGASERSYAWLPGLAGIGALIGLHIAINPTSSPFSWQAQIEQGLKDASAMRFGLAWFAVFGPLLGLALFRWRTTLGVMRARPDWSFCLIVLTALAWVAGVDRERLLVFASPIVCVVLARSVADASAPWTGHAAGALMVLQIVWTRPFLPIGAALPNPELGADAWARLGDGAWTLSTANLASHTWSASVVRFNLWATTVTVAVLIGAASFRSSPHILEGINRSSWWRRLIGFVQATVTVFNKVRPTVIVWTLTAATLVPLAWLALRRFYWTNFATAGAEYLLYNLARIWLVLVMLAVFRSTGARLLYRAGDAEARGNRANDVDALVTGAAFWSIAVVLLATVHLYRAPIVMVLLAAGVRLAVGDWLKAIPSHTTLAVPNGWRKWVNDIVVLAIVAQVVAIVVTIVLWGDFGGDNDAPGNYLPYYETVLRAHANAPNAYWVHFFVSRGSGLAFLFNIVSDVQGAALASALMIAIGAGMLLTLVPRRSAATGLAALTGVLLLLQFYAGESAYVKSHIVRNLFVAYIVISFARALFTNEASTRRLQVSRLAALVAATVMSPLTTILLLPLFALELLLVARLIGRDAARRWLIYPATALGVAFAVCLFNYVAVGIPELHMMPPAVGKLADLGKLGRWLDPQLSHIDYRLAFLNPVVAASQPLAAVVGGVSPTSFLGILQSLVPWPVAVFALVGCMAAVISRGLGRKRLTSTKPWPHPESQRVLASVLYLGAVFSLIAFLRIFEPGAGSLQRFTAFTVPVVIAFGLILMAFSVERASSVAERRGVELVLLVAVVVAISASPATFLRLPWRDSMRFLFGAMPYAAIYDGQWQTQAAWEVARAVPDGTKIELLSFLPGFTAIPSTPFQRPDGTAYLREYTTVLFGSEEEASNVYRRYGIDYFLIDLSPGVHVVWSGYSSLFSVDAMRARLRPVARFRIGATDLYLFTWRNAGDVVDTRAYDEFLTAWERKLTREREGGYFREDYDRGRQNWRHEYASQQRSTP